MARRSLTFRHIEAFRAVMATGSMTEASRRLHTSQPQVSRLIGQLEGITGLPLFDRGGSRLVPTLDGTRFHAEVERAFIGLSSLEVAASRIRAFGAERLRAAAMPRLAGGLLARAVARFRQDHPGVVVAIHSGDDETCERVDRRGRLRCRRHDGLRRRRPGGAGRRDDPRLRGGPAGRPSTGGARGITAGGPAGRAVHRLLPRQRPARAGRRDAPGLGGRGGCDGRGGFGLRNLPLVAAASGSA